PIVVRSLPQEVQDLPEIDKPWIMADSTTGNLYLSYTRYHPNFTLGVVDDSIMFTRSTDNGAHWSPSITLSSAAAAGWVQGSRPVAGPSGMSNGVVYVAWKEIGQTASGQDYMRIRRSDDFGVTFANEQTA